jgi:four helix bundle protein
MEKSHKKLKVWHEAMELAKVVYKITSELPANEKYGLVMQMRRAVVSIPSNIAEGAARQGNKESIQFFTIARGSLSELDTQIELCRSLRLLSSSNISLLTSHVETVDALLSGLIRYKRQKGSEKSG